MLLGVRRPGHAGRPVRVRRSGRSSAASSSRLRVECGDPMLLLGQGFERGAWRQRGSLIFSRSTSAINCCRRSVIRASRRRRVSATILQFGQPSSGSRRPAEAPVQAPCRRRSISCRWSQRGSICVAAAKYPQALVQLGFFRFELSRRCGSDRRTFSSSPDIRVSIGAGRGFRFAAVAAARPVRPAGRGDRRRPRAARATYRGDPTTSESETRSAPSVNS